MCCSYLAEKKLRSTFILILPLSKNEMSCGHASYQILRESGNIRWNKISIICSVIHVERPFLELVYSYIKCCGGCSGRVHSCPRTNVGLSWPQYWLFTGYSEACTAFSLSRLLLSVQWLIMHGGQHSKYLDSSKHYMNSNPCIAVKSWSKSWALTAEK